LTIVTLDIQKASMIPIFLNETPSTYFTNPVFCYDTSFESFPFLGIFNEEVYLAGSAEPLRIAPAELVV